MKLIIIAKKEFKSLLSEKTLLLAILIQLFIAAFSSFLMVGLISFFEPEALGEYNLQSAQIGVIGSGELDRFLDSSSSPIKPHYYNSFSNAYEDFMDGSLDAILVIPDTKILEEENKIIYLSLYLPKSDIKATLVTLQLKEPLEKFENYVREQRLIAKNIELLKINYSNKEKEEKKKKKSTTNFEFIYVMLLPLLVLTPAFISGGLIIDTVTEEFERKTIDLLLVSPILLKEVLNGKMLTSILIAPLQAGAWLLLLQINGISIHNNILILLLNGIIAFILVLISAIVSVTYKDRRTSQYIYSLILITLFLSSNLFANSPMNLTTRLAIDKVDLYSFLFFGFYAIIPVPLYKYLLLKSEKYK